jgi:hypothetical protein
MLHAIKHRFELVANEKNHVKNDNLVQPKMGCESGQEIGPSEVTSEKAQFLYVTFFLVIYNISSIYIIYIL